MTNDTTLPDGAFKFDFRGDFGFVFCVCVWTQTPAARKVAEDYMREVDLVSLRLRGCRNGLCVYSVNWSKRAFLNIREYLADKGFKEIGEDHPLWVDRKREMEEVIKDKESEEDEEDFVRSGEEYNKQIDAYMEERKEMNEKIARNLETLARLKSKNKKLDEARKVREAKKAQLLLGFDEVGNG